MNETLTLHCSLSGVNKEYKELLMGFFFKAPPKLDDGPHCHFGNKRNSIPAGIPLRNRLTNENCSAILTSPLTVTIEVTHELSRYEIICGYSEGGPFVESESFGTFDVLGEIFHE